MSPVGAHDQIVLPDIVHEVGEVFPLLVCAIETVSLGAETMMGRRAYICSSKKSQTCGDSKI